MYVSQSRDHEVIAKLNRNVHNLHAKLYPKYFKEYNYNAMKETFKNLVENDNFVFLVLKDHEVPIGYAWIEINLKVLLKMSINQYMCISLVSLKVKPIKVTVKN